MLISVKCILKVLESFLSFYQIRSYYNYQNPDTISKKNYSFLVCLFKTIFNRSSNPVVEEESWDTVAVETTKSFHKYPLPLNTIHLLSTEKEFDDFLKTNLTVSNINNNLTIV